jgi:hypothetical protein
VFEPGGRFIEVESDEQGDGNSDVERPFDRPSWIARTLFGSPPSGYLDPTILPLTRLLLAR